MDKDVKKDNEEKEIDDELSLEDNEEKVNDEELSLDDNNEENDDHIESIDEEDQFLSTNQIKEKTIEEIREDEIELRLQELEITMDQLEQKILANTETDEFDQQFLDAKQEYNDLLKEKKEIHKKRKKNDTSQLNQLSIWIIFYGIIMILICLPVVSYNIWLDFADIIIDALQGSFSNIVAGTTFYNIVLFFVIFSLPILLIFVSWILFVNVVKKKIDKKVFIGIWVLQSILTISMIIYISVKFLYA